MASNFWFIDTTNTLDIYFSGTAGQYTGSGTPWTAQATSPIELAMNDVGGSWTPTVPQSQVIYGGGPPFTNGQRRLFKAYPNVTETIPLQLRGSSFDNCIVLKHLLVEKLNGAPQLQPIILAAQPNGSTNIAYTEVYNADFQEDARFINEESANYVLRGTLTLVRAPFWVRSKTDGVVTLINGATINNTGTGSPDNVESFGTGLAGELINEGQPVQIRMGVNQNTNYRIFYLASLPGTSARIYSTTGAAALSTSSTTGTQTALNAPSLSTVSAMQRKDLKARSLMRFTNNTSNVQIRVEMRASTNGTLLYAGSWITPTSGSATLYDMGEIPLDVFRPLSPSSFQLYIGYRSTDGNSATTTLGYNEFLLYHDFCRVDSPTNIASAGNATHLLVYSVQTTGAAQLPMPIAASVAYAADSSSNAIDVATIRGRAPRVYEGGALYAAWTQASNVHTTTDTAGLIVRHSPLWLTFRGGD